MTTYDCTMFLNENDLFEIRLNQHWDFIDKFIVVEAGQTHTGDNKPFNFDHERFKPYAEKIVYVKFENFQDEINKFPELVDVACLGDRGATKDDWIRDHFQANYLYKVMTDLGAKDEDIVYISCLDEIIKKSAFEEALIRFTGTERYQQGLRPVFGFHLNLYVYKINLLCLPWKDHVAGMISEFGNFKKILPTAIRDSCMSTHSHILNAGYHFTFLDDTNGEKVLTKQKSWAHSRDAYPGQKLKYDNATVEEALARLFQDYQPKIVPITADTHPEYIVNNLDKFQNLIYRS